MTEEIRLWCLTEGDTLEEIASSSLKLEERLESWIELDISILSPNLLVLGRQVETDFGGVIDLLCLDINGDTVIVELKKDRTPREVTAQALEYACPGFAAFWFAGGVTAKPACGLCAVR